MTFGRLDAVAFAFFLIVMKALKSVGSFISSTATLALSHFRAGNATDKAKEQAKVDRNDEEDENFDATKLEEMATAFMNKEAYRINAVRFGLLDNNEEFSQDVPMEVSKFSLFFGANQPLLMCGINRNYSFVFTFRNPEF